MRVRDSTLKVYYWEPCTEAGYGLIVVADNFRTASALAYKYHGSELGNSCGYHDQRIKLLKHADPEGLPEGVVTDQQLCLRRGYYDFYEGECPLCGSSTTIYHDKKLGKTACHKCLYGE